MHYCGKLQGLELSWLMGMSDVQTSLREMYFDRKGPIYEANRRV